MKTKSILLVVILLTSSLAYSQTSPKVQDTFFGCKFGTSIDAVNKSVREKGYKTFQENKNALKAYDLAFAGYDFYSAAFHFVNNKMYGVEFSQHFTAIDIAFNRYLAIKNDLTKRYGQLKDNSDDDLHYEYWNDSNCSVSISMSKKSEPSKAGAYYYYVKLIYINQDLNNKNISEL